MSPSADRLRAALASIVIPELGATLEALDAVEDVRLDGDRASVALRIPVHAPAWAGALVEAAREAARSAGASDASVRLETTVTTRDVQEGDGTPGVANLVLVMSGKGGVGKSTVATNLALALKATGASVGLLDADMYGPSIPTMLGVMGRPAPLGGKFVPLERFGVKLMSIGFLLEDERQAVVWRGPMLQGALLQFLRDVEWGTLDYLVLDLPPGTGDVALTISQKVKSTGALVVTTPQEVALQDVYKSVAMAQKVGIPILGVVENESGFVCDGCGKRHTLFGEGGGARVAEMADAPLLGSIPIDPAVREWGDAGTPIVQAAPDSTAARAFREVAGRLADRVARHNLARPKSLVIDRSGGQQRHLPIMKG